MKWYLAALKKYATFSGRAQRSEYWYFTLFWWLISIGLAALEGFVLGGLFGSSVSESGGSILAGLFVIGMFIPSIAVSVRRLHDTNRSGWWYLLNALPLIGWLVLFIFYVQDSQSGANSFGPNPKGMGDNQAAGESVPVRGSKALIIGISAAIAVPVLGILLAVALPAYQKYTERARKAEASAASQTPAKSVKQASTATPMQVAAPAPAPAIPVAPPPVAVEAPKPAIEAVKAAAVQPPAVDSPPLQPVVTAPPLAKPKVPVAEAKTKARKEQAPIRVASESAGPPKLKPKAKQAECVYKPVMSDEDIANCR